MHVLMVAAENDALPNAKVGGVADVVRDCPKALVEKGLTVDVVIPDYGFDYLERHHIGVVHVPFAGQMQKVDVWKLAQSDEGVTQLLISHWEFSRHNGAVYCNDEPGRPFATDASKFALFNAAVCEALLQGLIRTPDVVHLHDWHSACVALLLKTDSRYKKLSHLFLAYTVHNLALQGIRPFKGDSSSLEAWFPSLGYNGERLCDPRYFDCFNPMRSAINLVDKVHLVSPTYCQEVLRPSDAEKGFFGGEGLEADLQAAYEQGRVVGILNGCEYPGMKLEDISLASLYQHAENALFQWMAKSPVLDSSYYIAHQRLLKFKTQPFSGPLVTSVGRLTDQKALLLRQPYDKGLVLDELCQRLKQHNGYMIILGSGDAELEQIMTSVMARQENLLFLKGYAHFVGEYMYHLGDLFLMPSSFEPCGISQMLAMRAGQPCLVHGVGGLRDTVEHHVSGFSFQGESLASQSYELVTSFSDALELKKSQPEQWCAICEQAKNARFTWQSVAEGYLSGLYQ
ncbi:glycosyltransferase [Pseudoalteromonas shioyasakiensis]|uniref:glycogen synthase n=1 Tax=Pseudoalteromonas TaxID=53246 RepID=UPI0020965F09|nr:glycogen/starch synthase [Pseudoalteromonas shioyasakiensis]MCO6355918.1 glycosyltransferase [Pseudoalteromonas shioyasakiensis]